MKKDARRRQGGRSKGEGKCTADNGDLRVDGEGRWQRMKLYTHNDPAALYRADKAAWQQMKLHEADPDVVAYQEIRLQGKDNVVCAQMYDKEGRDYQRKWAQGVPLLVRRGLSVVQDKKVGARGRRALYDVATEHGQVVIINCHVPHGRRVKEYVAQLRMEYIRALERGPVIVVGDFNYDPRRRGAETELDRELRTFVEEMRLQDVSYSGVPGPSHYPAPEGSAPSRMDAVYADRSWVKGVTAGYMVGPEEMQDRKGHCPMMVTVDVNVGELGDEQEDEQGSDEEGVSLPPMVKWPEKGDERWQQWGQQVHAKMRQGNHVHQAMRRAARICGFTKRGGESQAQPKLQRLVATLRKRQHEEVGARAREEGAEWQTEVTQAKKIVRTARRAAEEEHKRICQKVVTEHQRYMERAVPYKLLRYIRELAEARKPQEMRAVILQCGRVTGSKKEVLEEVAQSVRRQHNQGQHELSGITRRMVRALPRVFTAEQSEDKHRSRGGSEGSQGEKEPGSGPAGGGGIPAPRGAGAGWSSGEGHRGIAHRRAPKGMGGQGAAPVQEGGSPEAGELETNMLCRHRGQAGPDGDLREDTAAAVFSRGSYRTICGGLCRVGPHRKQASCTICTSMMRT